MSALAPGHLKFIMVVILLMLTVPLARIHALAGDGPISDADKYAWSENAGWFNFKPTHGGVTVYDDHLSGYAWCESIGWVKLGSDGGGLYYNTTSGNYGVNREPGGGLSGYAWSETAGWINFNPGHSQVTIDGDGRFEGYAWSENVGWVCLRNATKGYGVMVLLSEAGSLVCCVWLPTRVSVCGGGTSSVTETRSGHI